MDLAPIVLFVYNRPWHTQQTLEALAQNILADQSELIVYADGPKVHATDAERSEIEKVRELILSCQWCKTVKLITSETNKGLAHSIIDGVTTTVNNYGKIIVLEDDIVTSKGFLSYMNDALSFYANEEKVMHISGYMFPVRMKLPETLFYNTASCWGWGTWARSWKYFSNDASQLLLDIYYKKSIPSFSYNNTTAFITQLEKNISGEILTWAIKWYASFFLQNGFALHPYPSLTNNIGHDLSGIHCGTNDAFYNNQLAEHITVVKIPLKENKQIIKPIAKIYNLSKPKDRYKLNTIKHIVKVVLYYTKVLALLSPAVALECKQLLEKKKIKKNLLKEKAKTKAIPRFIPSTFHYQNNRIHFVDSASFLYMFEEIFEIEMYKFNTDSEEPLIIDCGSNIGLSVLYFKKIHPQAKIIAFEPDKAIYAVLQKNIEASKLQNVTAINKAVWDKDTVLQFQTEGADGGRVAIDSDKHNIKEVPAVRLQSYLENTIVDFLKIDIEGAELTVLNDCKKDLINVQRIFVECHSFVGSQQQIDEILTILKEAGFRVYMSNTGLRSQKPFMKIYTSAKMDMQLNIYGYR